MGFSIHGLNGHEAMPMNRLFEKRPVKKTDKVDAYHAIDAKQHDEAADMTEQHHQHEGIASKAYSGVEHASENNPVIYANEIMSSPVEVLRVSATLAEALQLFEIKGFRHIPVISSNDELVGLVSDRDVLQYMGDVSSKNGREDRVRRMSEAVSGIMTSNVVSATRDTDVRYVARLFVEGHIGSMPIIDNGELVGIITRSDILRAVMRKFNLELWV